MGVILLRDGGVNGKACIIYELFPNVVVIVLL